MDESQIRHLLSLRAAHEQNLRANRIRRANFGHLDAPAHIDIEIAEAEKGIRLIDAQLGMVQAPQDVLDAIGPQDAAGLLLEHRVKLLDQKVGDGLAQLADKVTEVADQVVKVVEQVTRIDVITEERYTQEQKIRKERQQEHDERTTEIEGSLMLFKDQLKAFTDQIDRRWWVDALLIAGMVTALVAWFWPR